MKIQTEIAFDARPAVVRDRRRDGRSDCKCDPHDWRQTTHNTYTGLGWGLGVRAGGVACVVVVGPSLS